MEASLILPDVQNVNLQFLLAAHHALIQDYVAATYIFHLPPALSERLRHTSIVDIERVALSAEGTCLLAPIPNMSDLFEAPDEMVSAAAVVGMRLNFAQRRITQRNGGEKQGTIEG